MSEGALFQSLGPFGVPFPVGDTGAPGSGAPWQSQQNLVLASSLPASPTWPLFVACQGKA